MQFEVINGVDVKAFFRIPVKKLAAYAVNDTYNSDILNYFKEFEFDQLKLISHETNNNNNYLYGAKSSASVGVNLGIPTHKGQLLLKDGKEASIEVIKRFLYDSYINMNLNTPSTSTCDSVEYGYGVDVIEDTSSVDLFKSYDTSTFYLLDENSLPPFDIMLVASNPSGDTMLSYRVYSGVSITGEGSSEDFQSLEANSAYTVNFTNITPWIKVGD